MIRKLTQDDINQVVEIHLSQLPGFLSLLGRNFLTCYYQASLSIPEMFTFVEKRDEQILGFATGAVRLKGLIFKILSKDILGFIFIFLNIFFTQPILLLKSIKILSYPGFNQDIPELLTISVKKTYQSRGIGKKLFQTIRNEFQIRGIKYFQVSIYNRLTAGKFYEKLGCRMMDAFTYQSELMKYFLCKAKVNDE